jgi:flavoprotein
MAIAWKMQADKEKAERDKLTARLADEIMRCYKLREVLKKIADMDTDDGWAMREQAMSAIAAPQVTEDKP